MGILSLLSFSKFGVYCEVAHLTFANFDFFFAKEETHISNNG